MTTTITTTTTNRAPKRLQDGTCCTPPRSLPEDAEFNGRPLGEGFYLITSISNRIKKYLSLQVQPCDETGNLLPTTRTEVLYRRPDNSFDKLRNLFEIHGVRKDLSWLNEPPFNQCLSSYSKGFLQIDSEGDLKVSYDNLRKISENLGTTDINLSYIRETGPWSEYTPGDPSTCTIWVNFPDDGPNFEGEP